MLYISNDMNILTVRTVWVDFRWAIGLKPAVRPALIRYDA